MTSLLELQKTFTVNSSCGQEELPSSTKRMGYVVRTYLLKETVIELCEGAGVWRTR